MSELDEAREKINLIDKKMISLFEERMDCVSRIVAYKRENSLPIFDSKREDDVIKNILSTINNSKYKLYAKDFIVELMKISKEYQSNE